ncbi:MAG: hypothetical protein ABII27_03415 [bacterium]
MKKIPMLINDTVWMVLANCSGLRNSDVIFNGHNHKQKNGKTLIKDNIIDSKSIAAGRSLSFLGSVNLLKNLFGLAKLKLSSKPPKKHPQEQNPEPIIKVINSQRIPMLSGSHKKVSSLVKARYILRK